MVLVGLRAVRGPRAVGGRRHFRDHDHFPGKNRGQAVAIMPAEPGGLSASGKRDRWGACGVGRWPLGRRRRAPSGQDRAPAA
jgi:hypothetical protein